MRSVATTKRCPKQPITSHNPTDRAGVRHTAAGTRQGRRVVPTAAAAAQAPQPGCIAHTCVIFGRSAASYGIVVPAAAGSRRDGLAGLDGPQGSSCGCAEPGRCGCGRLALPGRPWKNSACCSICSRMASDASRLASSCGRGHQTGEVGCSASRRAGNQLAASFTTLPVPARAAGRRPSRPRSEKRAGVKRSKGAESNSVRELGTGKWGGRILHPFLRACAIADSAAAAVAAAACSSFSRRSTPLPASLAASDAAFADAACR